MKTYKVNEKIAGVVPMPVPSEQVALNEDIAANGLNVPIVLYKNQIVDGRSRQIACKLANIELKTVSIPWETTIPDVIVKVKSLNTRRNLSLTQKAAIAYKEYKSTAGLSREASAKRWSISLGTLKNMAYIAKYKPDYVVALFDGLAVKVSYKLPPTTAISTIAKEIKKQREYDRISFADPEEIQFKVDSEIQTEKGKKWYASHKSDWEKSPESICHMIHLANLMFTDVDPDANNDVI